MHASNKKNNNDLFTIENNVLKGRVFHYTFPYTSLGELIFDKLKNNPNVIGQVDAVTEKEDTFANMAERVIKCALWLQQQGVEKGDIVASCSHNHLDSSIPFFATLFIGAIFSPWYYQMDTELAHHLASLTEPKVIFVNENSARIALEAAKIETVDAKVVCFGDFPDTIPFSDVLSGHDESAVANFRCIEIDDPQEISMILHTSGTTASPKCVPISHRAWIRNLELSNYNGANDEAWLWFAPLNWITGVSTTLKCIHEGVKRIIGPEFDEQAACEIVQKFKVSLMMLSTRMAIRFGRYSELNNYDLSSLKFLMTGGAPMRKESQDAIRKRLPNVFTFQVLGMTEFGGAAAAQLPDTTSGSCGVVYTNCKLKILDIETGKLLGPNQNGELCAKTSTMMTNYYKYTGNTIIDAEGWLHTGDFANYNEKGEVFIVDRLKDIIRYKGHHIMPTEIECVLQTHPAVLEVFVVGIPHPTDNEHPIAFVTKMENKEVTTQELMDMVEKNLEDPYKLRGGVKFISKIPHGRKISRLKLQEMAKTLAAH